MLDKIMQEVENEKFSARLNIASSFNVFLHAAYQEQNTKDLIKELRDSPKNRWLALQRATELSRKRIDLDYENPWDTAITIYLWALSLVDLDVAETAATFVRQPQNCWWATKFTNYLLNKKPTTKAVFKKGELEFEVEAVKPKISNITVPVTTFSIIKFVASASIKRIERATKAEKPLQAFSPVYSKARHKTSQSAQCMTGGYDISHCKPT